MPLFYIDRYYILLVVPAMLIALWAQGRVKSTYHAYARVLSRRGYTATEVARMILDKNGLQQVSIQHVSGELTDFYNPKNRSLSLSDSVEGQSSIAAIGVAAHEVGHAIQHANHYWPIQVRNAFVPITNIGSAISIPLALLGFFLGLPFLVNVGIILFASIFVFQLLTLPVEFDASHRAIASLESENILAPEEIVGAKKVLRAAAMTYVAATITALASLLRVIALFGGRDRR